METESTTVVGTFATFTDAQRAADHLYQSGFSRIRIARNDLEESLQDHPSPQAEEKHTGFAGFFSRLFGTEKESSSGSSNSASDAYFQDRYLSRHHLVVVERCEDPKRCREIIATMGGSVDDQGSHHYEYELQRNPRSRTGSTMGLTDVSESGNTMELREEVLDVHVDRVQTGEVRVRKEIITETKIVEIPVSREEIVVERRSLAGMGQEGTLESASLKGDMIEEIHIPISEEQIHIEKKVVPREEIRVSKERVTENETFSIDVSHEETLLESDGRVKIKSDKSERPRKSARDQNDIQPSV